MPKPANVDKWCSLPPGVSRFSCCPWVAKPIRSKAAVGITEKPHRVWPASCHPNGLPPPPPCWISDFRTARFRKWGRRRAGSRWPLPSRIHAVRQPWGCLNPLLPPHPPLLPTGSSSRRWIRTPLLSSSPAAIITVAAPPSPLSQSARVL